MTTDRICSFDEVEINLQSIILIIGNGSCLNSSSSDKTSAELAISKH